MNTHSLSVAGRGESSKSQNRGEEDVKNFPCSRRKIGVTTVTIAVAGGGMKKKGREEGDPFS